MKKIIVTLSLVLIVSINIYATKQKQNTQKKQNKNKQGSLEKLLKRLRFIEIQKKLITLKKQLKKTKKTKEKISLLYSLGYYSLKSGSGSESEKALGYFKKTLELSSKYKNDKKMQKISLETTSMIAQIYYGYTEDKSRKNHKMALKYFNRIIKHGKKYHSITLNALTSIASINSMKNNLKEAKRLFEKVIKRANRAIKEKRYNQHYEDEVNRIKNSLHAALINLSNMTERIKIKKKDQYKIFENGKNISEKDLKIIENGFLMPNEKKSEKSKILLGKVADIAKRFTCNTCGKEGKKLQKCSACKKTYYCSRKCQIKDWKEHKKICKKLHKKKLQEKKK
ncbi:zinc finger MYND domain-containing protein [Candidatus Dependentiae bacterium]